MIFDPNNHVIKLCAQGIDCEGSPDEARLLFLQAWREAATNLEKFVAAHYLARHQKSTTDKLEWDKKALAFALLVDDEDIKQSFPSLYLNIAKCYEDLADFNSALKHYKLAESYTGFLTNDGFGKMIKDGIKRGVDRVGVEA